MRYDLNGPRILSRPVGVEWAGWRTDTFALQQNGWELAAEFDPYYYAYRLLFKHRECRMAAITDRTIIEDLESGRLNVSPAVPLFHVRRVAATFEVLQMTDDFSRFVQIDARPQLMTRKIERLEDMNIFATTLKRTEEIVVDKADMTVVEHLEAIKRLQAPKQQEIRQRILREGATPEGSRIDAAPRMNVIAQLVEYRDAA
jgi:hypothetical protein